MRLFLEKAKYDQQYLSSINRTFSYKIHGVDIKR